MAGLTFLGPNVPSLNFEFPWALNTPGVQSLTEFALSDINYDWAIGGVPFLAGESLRETYFRRQYLREFAEIRKDQFDSLQSPGEQSFVGNWLEAQGNFHGGAGIPFLDTIVDQTLEFRYDYSEHVDVMTTIAQTTLLQATKSLYTPATGAVGIRGINVAGTDYVILADGPNVKRITLGGTAVTLNTGGLITHNIISLTDDGVNWYAANDQGIFIGALNAPGLETLLWNCTDNRVVIEWVKGRLVACIQGSVYELAGGSPPTLPTPKFVHLNPAYVFSSITATPTAIMVSGAAGAVSEIHRFTLDSGGALPVVTSGIVSATMPTGETINKIYAYVGSFLGICTNKGFRIANIGSGGDVVYGPLTILDSAGVAAVCGYDRYFFVSNNNGFQTSSGAVDTSRCGLWRIDTGTTVSNNNFAYMSDLDTHTAGTVIGVCNFGTSSTLAGTMAIALSGTAGVFVTDTANKETSGYLRTSKIRYNTLEPKHFKFAYLRGKDVTDGSINIGLLSPTQSTLLNLATYSSGAVAADLAAPIYITKGGDQVEWIQLVLTLGRGVTNANVSPTLFGFQLRALPGVDRQLILTLPLIALDHERDNLGTIIGYHGYAYERVSALEAATKSGNVVALQDLQNNVTYKAFVENYRFEQQATPEKFEPFGGYVLIQMRVLL